MRLLRRKPKLSLDDQVTAESERTGMTPDIYWSDYLGTWGFTFNGHAYRYSGIRSEKDAQRSALEIMRRAPDAEDTP